MSAVEGTAAPGLRGRKPGETLCQWATTLEHWAACTTRTGALRARASRDSPVRPYTFALISTGITGSIKQQSKALVRVNNVFCVAPSF